MSLVWGFDTETTGLLEPDQRIIEIALLGYDLATGKLEDKFIERFNPGRTIEPKAQKVHGIALEDVAHLPKLEENQVAIERIQRIFQDALFIVAHNGEDFDDPFIRQEFRRIGKILPEKKLLDTMKQARWATPLGKNPSLQELCFACGETPYDPALAHNAMYDVDRMMVCFFHALRKGFFKLP